MGAVDDVAARLTAQVTARTVYPYAAPNGALPARYLIVHGSAGTESSERLADQVDAVDAPVWVTSVSRNADPEVAAREAAWGAEKAREALRGWRPAATAWKVRSEASQPAKRDESINEATFYAVEQFSVKRQA